MPPFFSVGVTTYDRIELLKECLDSILKQTFTDFEIIVGNDFPGQLLTTKMLELNDPRIKIINHGRNMGEMENMNALMREAQGRYFSWVADDDMYFPDFFESVYNALIKYDYPLCVFTSYCQGEAYPDRIEKNEKEPELINGKQFLQLYLSRKLEAIGCYGIFDLEYIKYNGGIKKLGNGNFHPYSDNLLAIKAGLLERIVYIYKSLIFFRTHGGSISWISLNINDYSSAQEMFCIESTDVFRKVGSHVDFCSNLFFLLKWCIGDFATVVRKSGYALNYKQIIGYFFFVKRQIGLLRGSWFFWKSIGFLAITGLKLVMDIVRAKFKKRLIVLKEAN